MKYEKGNFITVPNKSELKKLDAHSQVLFMWLCSFTDEKGQCYPSVNRLAECCGLSRKTIIDRVKILIDRGFLTKIPRFADNAQQSNLYQIHLLPSANDTPPSVGEEKKVVHGIHPPSEPTSHRTKITELKPNNQKANLQKFKETIKGMFKN
ncbi:MAG: helix-turn-helix domain-containing protein [Nitrosomonas sp.]|uniref:helix-turn-helix domain-containing protein n=1 Tax=Nitrosomonas sp. TaxID=42353 RepID=UPI0032ED0BDB